MPWIEEMTQARESQLKRRLYAATVDTRVFFKHTFSKEHIP